MSTGTAQNALGGWFGYWALWGPSRHGFAASTIATTPTRTGSGSSSHRSTSSAKSGDFRLRRVKQNAEFSWSDS